MKVVIAVALAALLNPDAVPRDDAAALRDVLHAIGGGYCVVSALEEPPFAWVQRRVAREAVRPLGDDERRKITREWVKENWFGPNRRPLAAATEARLIESATALALRGDPTPLVEEPVGN